MAAGRCVFWPHSSTNLLSGGLGAVRSDSRLRYGLLMCRRLLKIGLGEILFQSTEFGVVPEGVRKYQFDTVLALKRA